MDHPSNRADFNLSGYNKQIQRNNINQQRAQNVGSPQANLDIAAQLRKLGQVRESLYSQNGWSSSNVNQDSKWDVGDVADATEKARRNSKRNSDTGTNIWSSDYQAQHAFTPNANCPGPSMGSYSGTGPMPRTHDFLYDEEDMAERSGVESLLAESEPRTSGPNLMSPQQFNGFDPRNAHMGSQAMNFNGMNPPNYANFQNPRNPAYGGFDRAMGQNTFKNECNTNDVPIHMQLQSLQLNQGFNAQMPDPTLNPITTTYPTAATRMPNQSYRGYNPTSARMQYPWHPTTPSTATTAATVSEWASTPPPPTQPSSSSSSSSMLTSPAMHPNQFHTMPSNGFHANPMCHNYNSNIQYYNDNRAQQQNNGTHGSFPIYPQPNQPVRKYRY